MIKHFVNCGSSCPRVLVATHFHDVFRNDVLDAESLSASVTFVHMQVMLASSKGEVIGASGESGSTMSGPVAFESQDDFDEGASEIHIRPNERITYLYR